MKSTTQFAQLVTKAGFCSPNADTDTLYWETKHSCVNKAQTLGWLHCHLWWPSNLSFPSYSRVSPIIRYSFRMCCARNRGLSASCLNRGRWLFSHNKMSRCWWLLTFIQWLTKSGLGFASLWFFGSRPHGCQRTDAAVRAPAHPPKCRVRQRQKLTPHSSLSQPGERNLAHKLPSFLYFLLHFIGQNCVATWLL